MQKVSIFMAFMAGFLSFFSPCILPLIPAYISYLTGISFTELRGDAPEGKRKEIKIKAAVHSLGFILGFSIIFIFLGCGATLFGKALFQYRSFINKLGGVIIIFFSLIIMEAVKVPFLERERKFSYKKSKISFFGSILVGSTFAIAWTPCVGPVLGSILIYASGGENLALGISLLTFFSLGLAAPFFLSALIMDSFLAYLKKIEKYTRYIKIVTGIVLLIFGIFLLRGGNI